MSGETPYTAVVVAQGESRQLLVTLLSLRQQARPSEVVLVDNGSGLALEPLVRLAQLSVRPIHLAERTSLAAAFNAGLNAASHETVLLLPAGSLLSGDPAAAVRQFHEEPDLAVVGPVLYRDDPPPRLWLHEGCRYEPSASRVRSCAPHTFGEGRHLHPVDGVTAPGMLVRRGDLRFDERYGVLLEDLDFCFRHRERGLSVAVTNLFAVTCSRLPYSDPSGAVECDLVRFASRWGPAEAARSREEWTWRCSGDGSVAVRSEPDLECEPTVSELVDRGYLAVRGLPSPADERLPSLPWTGERCVPEVMSPQDRVLREHMARYRWAADLVRGRYDACTVLDIPCGAGYGSAMLAALPQVSQVRGVDIDPATVAYARDRYGYLDGLAFSAGDLEQPQEPADVVVCFEGIEHVVDQEAAARSLCGALRPGGTLLVSTPNASLIVTPGTYHTHELDQEELVALFAPYLESWTIHGQLCEVGDVSLRRAWYLILEGRVGVGPSVTAQAAQEVHNTTSGAAA